MVDIANVRALFVRDGTTHGLLHVPSLIAAVTNLGSIFLAWSERSKVSMVV